METLNKDFIEYEDGECLPVVSPAVNGTLEAGECSKFGYEWTSKYSKDTPAGDGDYEYFHMFTSDEACANPTGIRASWNDTGAGSWPVHIDMLMGFWCVNSEQTGGLKVTVLSRVKKTQNNLAENLGKP